MSASPSPTLIRNTQPRKRELLSYVDVPAIAPVEHIVGAGYYLWLLRKAWWKIAIAVAFTTGLAVLLSYTLKPVYEATTRIVIDLKSPSSVVGETTYNTSASDADQYFNTELQVIQSDSVLRPVVTQFKLDQPNAATGVPFGMQAADAPVTLKGLTVTHPVNSFLINITYRSPDTMQAAAVANAIAHSYIAVGREMRAHAALEESAFMEKQIGALKVNMDDSVSALAFYEKQLGVINPEEKTSILTARLTQLNTQYTDAQNERLRKQVDYEAVKSGSTEAIEVSPQALALAKMEENVHTAQQKMETVKTIYGSSNAEYRHANTELTELNRQLAAAQTQIGKRIEVEYREASKREQLLHQSLLQTKSQSDSLNATSVHYQQLKHDAEANRALYAELYRKIREAGINGAFQGNAIRITDIARPQLHPVFPNKTILIGLGLLFSVVLSVVVVLLSDLGDRTLRDPLQTQRVLDLEVLGILPRVVKPSDLSPMRCFERSPKHPLVKSAKYWFGTAGFYEEAARTLLSTLLISYHRRPLRSIMVTSAVQGEGKSCCVAHLAAMHAMQGYRTLLIDADLRCPAQHINFKVEQQLGLADVIRENLALEEVRRSVPGTLLLDVITAGRDSSTVCDQVGRAVESLLEAAYQEYDLVFIDAPPMLCFAEPIQLANLADGVLVVCRAGQTSREAVGGVLNSLRRMDKTLGLVLNQVHPRLSPSYGSYQSYYQHLTSIPAQRA